MRMCSCGCEWYTSFGKNKIYYVCVKCGKVTEIHGESKMSDKKIKITVEVDGEIVPLDTISTETFEKIKEATKEPEYEGVLSGNYAGDKGDARVFFVVTEQICDYKGRAIVLDKDGYIGNSGSTLQILCKDVGFSERIYENIKKLGD